MTADVSAPFALKGLDHVVLRVTDVEAALGFYCGVLGCTVDKVQETLGLTQLRAGAALIDIVDVAGTIGQMGGAAPAAEGRNMDHFCLRLDPWDEAALLAHLARHNIEVVESGQRYGAEGVGPSVYVRDPEGNLVELKGPPGAIDG